MEKKSKDNRYRNFYCLVYPESAPENWIESLSDLCIPAFISPLHDSDVDNDGVIKKAHYHVVLMFDGKKSLEQVREITDTFGGVGPCRIQSLRGYARYLCHMDNQEKAQYNSDDVKSLAGADYFNVTGSAVDRRKAIAEMTDFCDENNIYSFHYLVNYSKENRPDWFGVLTDSASMFMIRFLKSKQWERDNGKK